MNSGQSISDLSDSVLGNQRCMKDWPVSGLEYIEVCPVCNNSERTILHKDLVDNVFFCAPGKWNLWKCTDCESAYLDPRPSKDSIHLAYENYYTHLESAPKEEYLELNIFRKLRRQLVNGYTKWKFGAKDTPANVFGVLVAFILPSLKKRLDRQYRHLPKLPSGGGSLLDVGCGDGSFLELARNCGWNVTGIDFDPEAVANASKHGIKVYQGGIEIFEGKSELYDVITLNHVIEHVHEPSSVLKSCHRLLKQGGQLWLETPNLDSYGHKRFQHNWRGLEPPRHLVIFNKKTLRDSLIGAGFMSTLVRNSNDVTVGMFQVSYSMENGISPYKPLPFTISLYLEAKIAKFKEHIMRRSEFIAMSAFKKQ